MLTISPFIESQQREIANVCQLNGVRRLELFGSRSRQDPTKASDFDFLVEFTDPLSRGLFDRFLALQESLEQIVGKKVDLVEVSSIENPYLRRRIDKDRKLVYAA